MASGARSAADPAPVLRGHRQQPGALRVGLRPPDAPDPRHVRAPAGRRRRGRRSSSVPSSCSNDRCSTPCAPATGRCCWWTRSTVPTTSSRRSCSSCSPTSRSPSPRSAPSWPSGRRSWCSPPTAPASCTTPSSAAASTTGSATRAPSARSRSCWSASPASAEALARKVVAAVNRLRALELAKPPGVAETIDWVRSLGVLGADDLDPEVAADTIGAVVKERDDLEQVSGDLARITSGA